MRSLNWLTLMAVVALWTAAPAWADGVDTATTGATVVRLTEAQLLLDDVEQPPPDDAPWVMQTLPDNWSRSRPESGGFAWYRLVFTLPNAEGAQAVYVNRASMNAAVYVNGLLIGSGGSFEEPVARNGNRPYLYVMPQPMLKPGANVMHVRLRVYPRTQGGLSVVHVGPEGLLRATYESALFFSVTLNQVVSLFTFALGVLFFLLWTRRRVEAVYCYFGIGMMLWGVHGLKLFVRTIPVPAYYWDLFTSLVIPVFTATLVPFVFRFVGRRHPHLERLVHMAVVLLVAAHVLLGPPSLYRLATAGYALSTVISVPLLYLLTLHAWRHPNGYRLLIVFAGAVCVCLAVHDLYWQLGLLDFETRPLLQFGGPLLFLGMGGELLSRFANALSTAELANVQLELRVAQKSDELASNYRKLHALNRERAMIEERQRIMRDMHDGIGGQLITAITRVRTARLKQDQLEAMLGEMLDDLRLVIDSLQRTENDLGSALGNFRYRLEPRLKSLGIALEWRLDGSVDELTLQPSDILHALRIVQEAFTNILKHSGATRVCVASSRTTINGMENISLSISDNGVYRPGRCGYGVGNIMARARAIGGSAQLLGGEDGTCLTLNVPQRFATDQGGVRIPISRDVVA